MSANVFLAFSHPRSRRRADRRPSRRTSDASDLTRRTEPPSDAGEPSGKQPGTRRSEPSDTGEPPGAKPVKLLNDSLGERAAD
jgi:hypothetical protein